MRLFLLYLMVSLILPDLLHAQSVAERKQAFQLILNKQKTPEAKISKAEALALDTRSKFRVDAINYLIDQKSISSCPVLVVLLPDEDVREFAIYGIGELEFYEATPLLIGYMRDENRNNRGNAFRALQKMYPRDFNFEFHHDDTEYTRNLVVQNIENWWKTNRDQLKARVFKQKNEQEKKEAEERWNRYAKEYLDRPNS